MTERPPPRPELRPDPMADDPRARALARAEEIRANLKGNLDEGPDKFYINEADIPEGWSVEWKRIEVMGKEDPAYEIAVARKGWEPAPPNMFPGYMPANYKGKTIDRDGLRLMMRPAVITEEVKQIERDKANAQMRQNQEKLQGAPPAPNSPFQNVKVDVKRTAGRTMETIPVPQE